MFGFANWVQNFTLVNEMDKMGGLDKTLWAAETAKAVNPRGSEDLPDLLPGQQPFSFCVFCPSNRPADAKWG
jgi:hypothetical protein